jgi:hypothetical protein
VLAPSIALISLGIFPIRISLLCCSVDSLPRGAGGLAILQCLCVQLVCE